MVSQPDAIVQYMSVMGTMPTTRPSSPVCFGYRGNRSQELDAGPGTPDDACMSALAATPVFSLDERDRRWARVRAEMDGRGIDLLVVLPQAIPTDVLWLAQELGAVLFPSESHPWIVLGGEDSHLAVERAGWIGQRSSATPFGATRVPFGAAVAERVRALDLHPRRVGLVGLDGNPITNVRMPEGYLLHTSVVRILDALGAAEVVDGTPVMAAARYVKSEAEIGIFQASVEIAEASAAAMAREFEVGRQQADVYRAGMAALLQPGVTEANLAWCPGAWGEPRPRFVGPPPGTVGAGLCVAAEIYPGVHGYVAQVAQPFVAGELTGEQRDAFALNLAAFDATCAALRPGATWREVEAAALGVADGTDWKVCFLLHAGPDGPLFVPNGDHEKLLDTEVEAGTVFVCKPHVYPREPGVYRARSHDVAWGDTVVVRQSGAVRLGGRAREVVVAPAPGPST
jgi:Xaa-Pro aminopeptidase